MKVIFVRSPYKILINEATQVYTRCVIDIIDPEGVLPTKTVTLEKQIPDIINRDCWFNISPYIKDEIENIATGAVTPTDEDFYMWRKVEVTTYWKVDLTDAWTELEVQNFVAVNGYNDYQGGYNQFIENDVVLLTNPDVNIYRADDDQYFNVLVDYDWNDGYDLIYRYRDLSGTTIENFKAINLADEVTGIFMLKVPYRGSVAGQENGNSVQVRLDTTGTLQPLVYFLNGNDCLYTPVKCTFINSKGGWQYLTFFKARTDNYEVKSKGFNLLADAVDYNPLR